MKKVFLYLFLALGIPPNILCQNLEEQNKKLEIGIDFVKFNKDRFYRNGYLYPVDGTKYLLDFTPSIFIRLTKAKNALRLKIEYFQKDYFYDSGTYDFSWREDGNFKNYYLMCGYQRFLISKEITEIYAFSDIGFSYYKYKGFESTYNWWTWEFTKVPFNINGIGISIQSGVGFKLKIIKGISIDLESALLLEKSIDNSDENLLLQDIKFIPKPLCLFGISYSFK